MNQSVLKALRLLDFFVKSPELTLAELSTKADMPKPTVYRLLSSLEVCGFLIKVRNSEQDIKYRLGLKLLELGNVVSEQLELRKVALPHMKKLCEEINEVVHLVIMDGYEAVYIEKVESKQALRLYTKVGKRSPLYVGSGPKLLLANLPAKDYNRIVENIKFNKFTENTILNKMDLKLELETIRSQGYAVSSGEQDLDTIGFSFPVKDHTGNVIAALGVSGPTIRFLGEREIYLKQETKIIAKKISKDLGFYR